MIDRRGCARRRMEIRTGDFLVKPKRLSDHEDPRTELETVAHELSERLTAIGIYIETARRLLARQMERGKGGLAEILDKTSAQADRAGQIIRRLHQLADRDPPRQTDPKGE